MKNIIIFTLIFFCSFKLSAQKIEISLEISKDTFNVENTSLNLEMTNHEIWPNTDDNLCFLESIIWQNINIIDYKLGNGFSKKIIDSLNSFPNGSKISDSKLSDCLIESIRAINICLYNEDYLIPVIYTKELKSLFKTNRLLDNKTFLTNFRVFLISSLGTRQEYICDFFIESGKLYFTKIDLLKSRLILDEEWSYHQLSSDYLPYMSFRKKYFIDYLSSSDRIEITNYDFHLSFDIKDFEKSFTGVLKNQINKELEEYKTNNNIK